MNIQMDFILLDFIAFKTHDFKSLNQTFRPLNTVQEFHDLPAKILFCFRSPVFESPSVQEVEQYLGHVIKYTYHRISLQTDVISVE
ncbi:hypothetical protein D3C86_2096430 [compost metagenome]